MKRRDILAAAAITMAASTLFSPQLSERLYGQSLDVLFWLRQQAFGPRHDPATSPTAVIAFDEETYRLEPFRSLPKVMWTKQVAQVMDATLAGGARVIGFDVIFPTSVEQYVKGFDRDFLVSLNRASQGGRVVLGKVQHQLKPITPFAGYSFAVGHGKNIRSVNLRSDRDGVIRRAPLTFLNDRGESETSMALELAARASRQTPELLADGRLSFDGQAIPGSEANAATINFEGGPGAIPTYSFADLHACAEGGNTDYFQQHFAEKVVLIGAVLDVEDRKLTSKRLITAPEGRNLPRRCANSVMEGLYAERRRDTIPAVYVHAQVVNDLLRHESLVELTRGTTWAILLAVTGTVAALTISLPLSIAGLAMVVGLALWTGLATWLFNTTLVLPLLPSTASGLLAFAALLAYRYGVADKEKRYIRQAFSLYLPEPVVDRMIAGGRVPTLGGETRDVTIWFSDIADFASLSERMTPEQLVGFVNDYLSEVTELLDRYGGFIDKYVGDAVVAVFGAPLDDPDHARHAVQAALACQERLQALGQQSGPVSGDRMTTRIGIHSGDTLVGNIGSRRRFNYTVMGDTVNLASRLEGANKIFGTKILVSEATAALCRENISFREIDLVRVAGRETPVRIFEPLGQAGAAPVAAVTKLGAADLDRFAEARAAFRAGRFAQAEQIFQALSAHDPVAAHLAERAGALVASPPPSDWDGVTNLAKT